MYALTVYVCLRCTRSQYEIRVGSNEKHGPSTTACCTTKLFEEAFCLYRNLERVVESDLKHSARATLEDGSRHVRWRAAKMERVVRVFHNVHGSIRSRKPRPR